METNRPLRQKTESLPKAIPKPVLFSLLFYLGTLSLTQTVYGWDAMTYRWIALLIFTVVSAIYWLFCRGATLHDRMGGIGSVVVLLFMGATLLSVVFAENPTFSGLRWVTQAMMILSFMIFIRGSFNSRTSSQILLIIKIIFAGLIFVSISKPATLTVYDSIYFRGVMGNSNSLGHVAMIGALIFLHGGITARKRIWGILQYMIFALSTVTIVLSGARSSMAAFLVGLLLIHFYYGLTRSPLTKAAVILLGAILVADPAVKETVLRFVAKEERRPYTAVNPTIDYTKPQYTTGEIIATREALWSEAWEGFKKRPFVGWGFGADDEISKEWIIQPHAITMTRDITNDILFILEGSGLVGLVGYCGLILSIILQSPKRRQIFMLRKSIFRGGYFSPMMDHPNRLFFKKAEINSKKLVDGKREEKKENSKQWPLEVDQVQSIMYILCVSLVALFLLDCSAFSAGSLLSAILWISAGVGGALWAEAVARDRKDRSLYGRVGRGQGFRVTGLQGSKVQGEYSKARGQNSEKMR